MTRNKKRIFVLIFFFVMFVILICNAIISSADMGPKESIDLTVKNPPDERYYIDLLKTGDYTYPPNRQELYENLVKRGYDPKMTKTICDFYDDGWTARMGSPLGDEITESNENHIYKFDYMDVPYNFKILVVTESGKIIVSDKFKRKSYNAVISYDMSSGVIEEEKVQERIPISSYAVTLIITLIIEGVIYTFKWFKFEKNCKRNIVCILFTNIFTQILLYISLNYWIFGIIIAEITILVIESVVYALIFKSKSRSISVSYAVLANLASFFLGGFIGIAIL